MIQKMFFRNASVFLIAALFITASLTVVANTEQKTSFLFLNQTTTLSGIMSDEVELRYYEEEGLSNVIGLQNSPGIWKSAIRLTQDEIAPYRYWNLTKVNVAFSADNGHPLMEIRIYVYEGDTPTKPGPIIVNDTTYLLDTTGVTTIPLVTPVDLEGLDEIWVAVEWNQIDPTPCSYAWLDTLTGPNVWQKSDWVYLNNAWSQLNVLVPSIDGRWGIGAIVEGTPMEPPDKPVLSGPTTGIIGSSYSFTVSSNDLQDYPVYYYLQWGDGSSTGWIGPYPSGVPITVNHSWSAPGSFDIIAKAKNTYEYESVWSDPHTMSIEYSFTSAFLCGVFLYSEEPSSGVGVVAPFFGLYIELQPFDLKLYDPSTPPMMMVVFNSVTQKGIILPNLIPYGDMMLGVMVGKFDALVMPVS